MLIKLINIFIRLIQKQNNIVEENKLYVEINKYNEIK